MKSIKFYKVNDPYGVFSNFSPSRIVVENEIWPTVEHYFQASKFEDFNVRDTIKSMRSPMDAAKEGRNKRNKLRPNWEDVKVNIMYKALKAKFLQHPELKKILLETGDIVIIEHTVNDNFWADGGDGRGQNMLGILLMRIREDIRKISDNPDLILPPWLAFPSIDKTDMFWRMGIGEGYLDTWFKYRQFYGNEKYKLEFPEPCEWENTYE